MAMDKRQQVVQLLSQKTKEGKLDWREAVKGDAFQVALTDKVLRIREVPPHDPDPDDIPDYAIDLVNGNGKVVDTFRDTQLGDEGSGYWWQKMHDLYEMARRKALRSDELLDEAVSELLKDSDDEVPF
jgi:hypothetical protein